MRWTSLGLSLFAVAFPVHAENLLPGASPEQRLKPNCLAYPGYVVVLAADPDSGGEGIAIRKRKSGEALDGEKSCRFDDKAVIFRTQPSGSSHFAGMIGDVAFVADEELRKSLFAYELPSGKELFVARHWEKAEGDAKAGTLSFSVPAQANECETSLRAQELNEQACRKRADEAVKCLRESDARYTKTPAKVELAQVKNGKGCRFDFVERYRYDVAKKTLEPTGEVAVVVTNSL